MAIADAEHAKIDAWAATHQHFDRSSFAAAEGCFDKLIEDMPISMVVTSARPVHDLWMQRSGRSPWQWDLCRCDIVNQHHFRTGLMTFIRVQYTKKHDARGRRMAQHRTMDSAQKTFEVMRDKSVELMRESVAWLQQYPDATATQAERAMQLMSDMEPVRNEYDMGVNLVYVSGNESYLSLSIWKEKDSTDAFPLIVYMESAPGCAHQDIPKILRNNVRKEGANDAMKHVPTNGFMRARSPSLHWETFVMDTFDTEVRRPLVRFMNFVRAHEPAVAADMVVTAVIADHVETAIEAARIATDMEAADP